MRRVKWSLAIIAVQAPLSFGAWCLAGAWAVLPVLLACNGARIFWAEDLRG